MVRVDWAQPALDDLREVYEFIARDSPRYAQLTVERITDVAGRLARFPQLGQILPELPHLVYRQMIVGAYRLIYRDDTERDRVVVMGVIHSSRDLPPILEKR
jgi:plasmid stabilization system protein ParE